MTQATPMFPLGAVLLPGEMLPLRIFEPRYVAMLEDVLAADGTFGVVLIERGSEVGGGDVRGVVGTLARIEAHAPFGHGRHSLTCRGTERIRVQEWLSDEPYPRAITRADPDRDADAPDWASLAVGRRRLGEQCALAARGAPGRPPDPGLEAVAARLAAAVDYSTEPASAASFRAVGDLPLGEADRQRALAAPDPRARVQALVEAVDDLLAAIAFRLQA